MKIRRKLQTWFLNQMGLTSQPVIKVYNGYGDDDLLLLFGHVFSRSPLIKNTAPTNAWSTSFSLLRMFLTKPYAQTELEIIWNGQSLRTLTDKDGFFKFEWRSPNEPEAGWHTVNVRMVNNPTIEGIGKILVPHPTPYGFISDIDDTLLISHSTNLRKRLYVLLTKDATKRKPFSFAVKHYRLLAAGSPLNHAPHPFFYVSSSEWNLYDYLIHFQKSQNIPEGILLLSRIKYWNELLKQGQTKHSGKLVRIAKVLQKFPHRHFVLLGDDTQQDPKIYARIIRLFPNRILCVYMRKVRKDAPTSTLVQIQLMKEAGVSVCYFSHSEEAIQHSKEIGLIDL
ncbi:MAG: DUF2183 domain-containing protein [Bacteroidetes bacterium]|nr:DUF2183 domain-containing protein [Bacteroidota bacterium]